MLFLNCNEVGTYTMRIINTTNVVDPNTEGQIRQRRRLRTKGRYSLNSNDEVALIETWIVFVSYKYRGNYKESRYQEVDPRRE